MGSARAEGERPKGYREKILRRLQSGASRQPPFGRAAIFFGRIVTFRVTPQDPEGRIAGRILSHRDIVEIGRISDNLGRIYIDLLERN